MNSLIAFLIRYHTFVLFVLLEVLSIYLITLNTTYQSSKIINSANFVSGNMMTSFRSIEDYFGLGKENTRLSNENALLRRQLDFYKNKPEYRGVSVEDSVHQLSYNYIPLKIVNHTITQVNNYITLSGGTAQGIEEETGVINGDGVVGIIKSVSSNFSVAISILHRDFRLSARHEKTGHIGSVRWNGISRDIVYFMEIPKSVSITNGDLIVSSGFSSFFPPGIPIAKVISVEQNEGDNFFTIEAKLTVDFKSIDHVYAVDHIQKKEKAEVEEQAINE